MLAVTLPATELDGVGVTVEGCRCGPGAELCGEHVKLGAEPAEVAASEVSGWLLQFELMHAGIWLFEALVAALV